MQQPNQKAIQVAAQLFRS